jgi:predicted acyl esterase
VHGNEHWTHFYTDYGLAIQKRFFDYFLKGKRNGWGAEPRVRLQVRHIDKFVERYETDWPIPGTNWTKFHLHSDGLGMSTDAQTAADRVPFEALGDGVTFLSAPLARDLEITGPIAAKLNISSSTSDADLFLIVRAFSPNLEEVVFQGALDPHTPLAQGWLRVSHRKLDPDLTKPYRPYHSHDAIEPLKPGEIYELDIEIWPTSIVIPVGYRLALSVRGRDYVYPGGSGGRLSNMKNEFTGCGPFLHDDPRDRPIALFGGSTTLHFGHNRDNYLLLPVIPPERA